MKKLDLVLTIIIGVIIGTLLCVLNILISLKTGLGFESEQIVAVGGFFILSIMRRSSILNINVLQATASGAVLATFAIDSSIAACVIHHQRILPLGSLIILSGSALMIGFMAAYFMSEYFIEQKKLTYPIGKATAKTILSLTNNRGKIKFLCIGVLISVAISIPIYVMRVMPDTISFFGLHTASFVGIALSPMLFGLGFLIGSRTSMSMACGAVLSIVLWAAMEGARPDVTYGSHLQSKWIMSLAISIMILSSFIPLINKNTLSKICNVKKRKERKKIAGNHQSKLILRAGILAIVLMLVTFFTITNDIKNTVLITIILLPILILGIVFICNTVGETGLSPVTPLGTISFIVLSIVLKDFREMLFGGAFICAATGAAVTMINSLKTAKELNTDKRTIMFGMSIGGISGAIAGAIVIIVMTNTLEFGSEQLPAPIAITWGAIVDSLAKGMVPENINPLICLLGLAIVLGLSRIGLSVICFGVGVMLSPSISLMIFLGGLCRKIIEMRHHGEMLLKEEKIADGELVMAGLIIGEGLAIITMLIKMIYS